MGKRRREQLNADAQKLQTQRLGELAARQAGVGGVLHGRRDLKVRPSQGIRRTSGDGCFGTTSSA